MPCEHASETSCFSPRSQGPNIQGLLSWACKITLPLSEVEQISLISITGRYHISGLENMD